MAVYVGPAFNEFIKCDDTVRFDSNRAKYSELSPAFDKDTGTITAGNSSPLTDGASAILIMEESRAKKEDLPILGYLRSYASGSVDPEDQLLIGPLHSVPKALCFVRQGLDCAAHLIPVHHLLGGVSYASYSKSCCRR